MGIEFRCTQCGNLLRVEQQFAGRLTKCPACGQIQQAPAAGGNPFGASEPSPAKGDLAAAGANPYASPASSSAALLSPFAAAPVANANQLDVGDLMQRSWDIYKSQMGICIVAMLVVNALIFGLMVVEGLTAFAIAAGLSTTGADDTVLAAIAILGFVLGLFLLIVVSSWLQAGMLRFILKMARHGEASLGDLFSGGPYILPLLAAGLLLSLMIGFGLLACVVPGVILFLMFSQASFLIVDRGAGVIECLSGSMRLTEGNKTNLALVFLLAIALSYASSLVPCGIGAIFVGPYISLLMAVTYLVLTGQPVAHSWITPQVVPVPLPSPAQ